MTIFEATGLSEVDDFEPDPEERIEIVKWPLTELDGAIEACHDSKSLIALHMLRQVQRRADARTGAGGGARRGGKKRAAMAVAVKPPQMRKVEARFEALVLDFLAYLEFERGLARNTLDAYRTDLLQLGIYLAERGKGATEVERADISEFLADLALGRPENGDDPGRPPCSPATISRKTACLRSFYRHLRREELIDADPTATLDPPQKSRKLPNVLSHGEVTKLLDSAKGADPMDLRDRALLEVMYGCGLRASEAVGLELTDVDLKRGFVRPHGKGSKERVVPLGSAAAAAITSLSAHLAAGARERFSRSGTCSSTSAAAR